MKKIDFNKELIELSPSEIHVKIAEWRGQLLSLRLNAATSHIKDYSQFQKLRRNIARGLTFLKNKNVFTNEKE